MQQWWQLAELTMLCCMQVCGTLEQVPDEVSYRACSTTQMKLHPAPSPRMPWPPQRFVYMKLDYHDSCPAEYEPPGFRPMENANAVHFSRKPFYMCGRLWIGSAVYVTCRSCRNMSHASVSMLARAKTEAFALQRASV